MAVYKVPQDVEADDKLIGPFSFRQFIYLIIVAISIAIAWFLGQIFIGLILLPMPIIILFGALALPLRKDQPMEVYLEAVVKFYLKPKLRMWDPEGQFTRVDIAPSATQDIQRTKDFGSDEASQRLSNLAQVIDSQGWSTRGITAVSDNRLSQAVNDEAASTEDVFDDDQDISRNFSSLIQQQEQSRRTQTLTEFQRDASTPPPAEPIAPKTARDYVTERGDDEPELSFNPYPNMRQRVISPNGTPPATTPASTSNKAVTPPAEPPVSSPAADSDDTSSIKQPSPDIIRLANNNDLSIDAIAREAHRIEEQTSSDQEVVVSLR